ncbi:hypothetical protein DPMN_127783 [Dreissena polymorpha]|uniref:Uncharacterized protein n=1 Tax=Dreissena polymorpha TaxID=45954 RepID=A0A9D4H1W0_DREPO|nr:hypothetical protein DPMN_127783 [Dreissena polymorpha]
MPICLASASRSGPLSLTFHFGVSGERLPRRIGCRLAKGVVYPMPTSLNDVFFNGLLLCSSPQFFDGDFFWSADPGDLHDAAVDEDLYLLYGGNSGSPCLFSILEYWLRDGNKVPNRYGDANCAGSTDVFQLIEGCSFFSDAGFGVCNRSSIVFHNAAERIQAFYLLQRLT